MKKKQDETNEQLMDGSGKMNDVNVYGRIGGFFWFCRPLPNKFDEIEKHISIGPIEYQSELRGIQSVI